MFVNGMRCTTKTYFNTNNDNNYLISMEYYDRTTDTICFARLNINLMLVNTLLQCIMVCNK